MDSAQFLQTLAGNFMDVVQYNEDNRAFEVRDVKRCRLGRGGRGGADDLVAPDSYEEGYRQQKLHRKDNKPAVVEGERPGGSEGLQSCSLTRRIGPRVPLEPSLSLFAPL